MKQVQTFEFLKIKFDGTTKIFDIALVLQYNLQKHFDVFENVNLNF